MSVKALPKCHSDPESAKGGRRGEIRTLGFLEADSSSSAIDGLLGMTRKNSPIHPVPRWERVGVRVGR